MTQQEYQPGKKNVLAAVLTVAVTYGYYLIFARFGFVKTILAVAGGEADAGMHLIAALLAASRSTGAGWAGPLGLGRWTCSRRAG